MLRKYYVWFTVGNLKENKKQLKLLSKLDIFKLFNLYMEEKKSEISLTNMQNDLLI